LKFLKEREREREREIIIEIMKRTMMSDDDRAAPLWKFVTDHPLVFGAEVLTKLNQFDLKIFYDLCRASRDVVKQSDIELNNEIRHVQNVKSMQELELAWDNYRFGEKNMVGGAMTQKKFCVQDILDDDRY
jgi:hypothetical protein